MYVSLSSDTMLLSSGYVISVNAAQKSYVNINEAKTYVIILIT